jgi:hypothetical protein
MLRENPHPAEWLGRKIPRRTPIFLGTPDALCRSEAYVLMELTDVVVRDGSTVCVRRVTADEAAFRDTLLRISEVVTVAPGVHELDVHPVVVTGSAAWVADVRIRVGDRLPPRAGRRVEY